MAEDQRDEAAKGKAEGKEKEKPEAKAQAEKPSVATRGVPSDETMYLPAHNSPEIRAFQDGAENATRNLWGIDEVANFVFAKKYQKMYNEIAVAFLKELANKTKMEGTEIGEFVSKNRISKATFYNRVLPRLKRVGMIKVERQTIVAKENMRKFRPMTIHLSKTFGNYLVKIGDSWLAEVDDARSKADQQKKLGHFEERK
jgi:hypothetical protein